MIINERLKYYFRLASIDTFYRNNLTTKIYAKRRWRLRNMYTHDKASMCYACLGLFFTMLSSFYIAILTHNG